MTAINILLLGSGGREHAIAQKILQSHLCNQLYVAPGNAGTGILAKNVALNINDFNAIEKFCRENSVTLIVVGPEEPLVNGIADYFEGKINLVGPKKIAAQLEGSKSFSKKFMKKYNIPTADYAEFTIDSFNEGLNYINNQTKLPIVIKADGLAAGKGVIIAETKEEAVNAFTNMLKDNAFGKAGNTVVIESFLQGIECSMFVITNGTGYIELPEAKDYKRIGEGDTGLNTGGMGAISPVPFVTNEFREKCIDKIIEPTLEGLLTEGISYNGFIFFGLINVDGEPYLIEYNCRMGDPETEVVFPRIKSDIIEHFTSLFTDKMDDYPIVVTPQCAATVMAVSAGYPGKYETGFEISLPNEINGNAKIFHAGTINKNGKVLTNGGRVLCVTTLANNLQQALQQSNEIIQQIDFKGKTYRSDIGWEFI
jgi:phosphoribosylamine---glycine ligase